MEVLDWLLDSDPAIRWQVLRDLVHAPSEIVAAELARVATAGWGARLLALQGEDGQWAGGACFPARSSNWRAENQGQPWTASLPTLQLLHDFGVENTHPGRIHFALEDGDARPSRWNTLRALPCPRLVRPVLCERSSLGI